MLLVKPILINAEHHKKKDEYVLQLSPVVSPRVKYLIDNPSIKLEEEQVYGGELYIHQGIEVFINII